jgi:predicted nucleic acid-binding protein
VRIYADTSVFGGYFDPEFAEPTRRLFAMFERGEARLVLSDLAVRELQYAPERVRRIPDHLPQEHVERILVSPEAEVLARLYVQEGVMRPSMEFDALHIATATLARVDVLVSWNFRDFVNERKIQGYNIINRRLGYPDIHIDPPREVIPHGK